MSNLVSLTAAQLRQIVVIKEKIEKLQAEMEEIGGVSSGGEVSGGRRKLSRAGRAAIARAQRARWAKAREGTTTPEKKKKRKFSAAVKAKLSAIAKARWAKAKEAGKSAL